MQTFDLIIIGGGAGAFAAAKAVQTNSSILHHVGKVKESGRCEKGGRPPILRSSYGALKIVKS